MYEMTKKHRTGDDVKEKLPQAVIDGLWARLKAMREEKLLIDSTMAVMFSDDYEDDKIFFMTLQKTGSFANEYDMAYDGPKDFLGHGTIVIFKDRPRTITMSISDANKEADEDESDEATK
ncbi:hypothetical protein [Lactiplantibacillus fabifermentans]|uniref:Uncharacterized protein n=2 Tax=Lactiplantibacillus fabifermentans TaxID=483011 RepID=A0A0R2NNY5_9LACO|nr:hypothetical protein [Lactiplantibacillus fabifermentans]ETY73563.1 hypothetical protein LFAB_11825 [Lactiplantibacillus fabifermentans T30PCM01]KRO27441.1 hypothetical protein DY78_GL003188 [Lactiplantibacillus fabifermentans DSM 21115]